MKIDQLRIKRAQAARAAAGAALGALRESRSDVARILRRWRGPAKRLKRALDLYEKTVEFDREGYRPDPSTTSLGLAETLRDALNTARDDLAEVFAALREQEVLFAKRKQKKTRVERHDEREAKKAARKAAKAKGPSDAD